MGSKSQTLAAVHSRCSQGNFCHAAKCTLWQLAWQKKGFQTPWRLKKSLRECSPTWQRKGCTYVTLLWTHQNVLVSKIKWENNTILAKENSIFFFPQFAECRNQKGHNSYYSCDLCFKRATHYEPQANPRDKRCKAKGATMVYPANGEEAELRSHERHLQLARRSRLNTAEDALEEFYGVKEGKIFLTKVLPHLDLVYDICIDWMHNVLEGKICLLGIEI